MAPITSPLGPAWLRHAPAEWLARWQPRAFALEGGETEVIAMGEGPALLLLPPMPGWKEAFVACAPRLARRFTVVTFDLRTRFEGAPSWDALVADVERVAGAFAPGAFALAGHSLGGALAQRYALAHPDRVRALVLSSTFARVTTPAGGLFGRFIEQPAVLAALRLLPESSALALAVRLAKARRWVLDPHCDRAVCALVVEGIRTVPPSAAGALVRLALAHDTRERLRSLHMPALLLAGERDTSFALEAGEELANLLPHAARASAPDAGHLHPLSRAEWWAERVGEWLVAAAGRARDPRDHFPRFTSV